MIPIYSRRVHRLPNYNNRRKTRRVYKGGSLFMGTPQLPDYRWVKGALKAKEEDDEDDDSINHTCSFGGR